MRTIKRAAPLAIVSVATVYMLVNIAYFAVVSKTDILGSRQIVAWVYALLAIINIAHTAAAHYSSGICLGLLHHE